MLTVLREFVLVREEQATAEQPGTPTAMSTRNSRGLPLPEIDDPRFGFAPSSKPRTIRRTWLETFDWRLFRAGLTLELRADRGTAELILTGRDGQPVATEAAGPASSAASDGGIRWPSRIDALPAGPLRERLASVVGVRALVPVTRAVSVLTELRAVNEDEKTIAMLAVDQMSVPRTLQRGAQPSSRLSVLPLRGYQSQAAKLADALERTPGVSRPVTSPFEAALATAGRRPGDYTGKIDVQLAGTMPAALALTIVLGRLFDTIEANLDGTISDIDTEFLHDLRVAVRRTRSVLKTAKAVLPDSLLTRYRAEFKLLGDLTTPTRDLDVYLLGYPSMARTLVAATHEDLEPLRQYLVRQRAVAFRQLAKGLRSARFKSLASNWRSDLEQVAAGRGKRPRVAAFAARKIARAHEQVLVAGSAINHASPPQALHDLRKLCKELRYLLEVFASLHDPADQWRAVSELKALQDCLGEFQDTDIQLIELRAFAERMMADHSAPARTLLAMGEIAADLATRQASSRGEFAGRFADFASARGQARIAALTREAA
ncbi:MAG TPA: CHAD domain-containing protein [Streptosporangiaceae bacterium]|nr:CHAD domain-containing protein [Streptosporangiaceae bacterium]